MLLFFGTRSTKLDTRIIRENTPCLNCSTENSFRLTTFGTYFHLFFIPIISLGKKSVIECQHCKKTYYKDELPNNIEVAIEKSYKRLPPKKGLWHSFGCFLIVGVFLFTFLLTFLIGAYTFVSNLFSSDSSNDNEEIIKVDKLNNPKPIWIDKLEGEMYDAEYFPDVEKDAISYGLYECLESDFAHSDKGNLAYNTVIKDNKILILISPVGIRKFNDKQRDSLYNKIDICTDDVLKSKPYQRYIVIFKGEKIYMQKTPKGFVKDSTANKRELLKDFFISDSFD